MDEYIKQEPYVGEDSIYIPTVAFVKKDESAIYQKLITKDLFVEAYEKWIKGASNE